jgi:hypothetical protein
MTGPGSPKPPSGRLIVIAWWKGQRVAVDVADGQKGPEAVGLRLI